MLKVLAFALVAIFAVSALPSRPSHLLGEEKCTWGPSYWCSNITNAAGCHAVPHCIQTVWQHLELPEDNDSVCQICKDMVKQARDQLESRETQEEIKQVFEGSCKLIPLKVINQECMKLADEFIPELIDTLASQMNPQVVCSVAGLCNSDRIDKLLEEAGIKEDADSNPVLTLDSCKGCHTVMGLMEDKFNHMSKDQVLQSILRVCGHTGSFSDSCSNIVISYFTQIYKHLHENFNANEVCLMAGECSAKFHVHANVQITPLSHIGYVPINGVKVNDDLPCDLCKQLVGHLRDLLVANTTEIEFKQVMEGLCRQTGSFKDECVNLVDQYYPEIYDFLVSQLNSSAVCIMTGICPSLKTTDVPIMPLLTSESAAKVLEIMASSKTEKPMSRVPLTKDTHSVQILEQPEQMQLPIERLTPSFGEVYNRQACTFCEYFLHYVQQAITNKAAIDEIKMVIDKACDKLPSTVNETCIEFVNTYGNAVVALLAQEIDPSVICPTMHICPGSEIKNVEIFMEAKPNKPNCPLCLFAVTKLEEDVKDKHSKEEIKKALTKLCVKLPENVKGECEDFVATYTDELVEMFVADMNPKEVCVFLKLCDDKATAPTLPPLPTKVATTPTPRTTTDLSNDIFDNTANGKVIATPEKNSPQCVICEFAMDQLEHLLENKTTDDEIKHVVHGICNHLPRSVRKECNGFVDQYADLVIQLLDSAMKPDEICEYLKLCDQKEKVSLESTNVKSVQCILCKTVMTKLEALLDGKITKEEVENAMHRVCSVIPGNMHNDCNSFIDKYGETIVDLLVQAVQPGEVCSLLFFCVEKVDLIKLEITKCAVCEEAALVIQQLLKNPSVDHSIEHVLEKTCRALPKKDQNICKDMVDIYGAKLFDLISHMQDTQSICHELNLCAAKARRPRQLGTDECTYGPDYWCANLKNARKCAAVKHCQDKVWKAPSP